MMSFTAKHSPLIYDFSTIYLGEGVFQQVLKSEFSLLSPESKGTRKKSFKSGMQTDQFSQELIQKG